MSQPFKSQDMQLQYCPILKKNVLFSKSDQAAECFKCHHYDQCKNEFGQCCNEFAQNQATM